MKSIARKAILYFVLLIVGIWIVGIIVFTMAEPVELTTLQLKEPYLCKKSMDGFIKVEGYHQKEDMLICGEFETSKPNIQKQINIFILEKNFKSYSEYYFYDLVWVDNDTEFLVISADLAPGEYLLELSIGRRILCKIPFVIIS